VWKAQNEIDNPDQAQSVVRLVDALEDCDDVSTVFHNFELTPAALEKLEE
jgi:transcriptional/translational regulatory protein YebC/TACO1